MRIVLFFLVAAAALFGSSNGDTLNLFQRAKPSGGFFDFVPRSFDGVLPGTTVKFVCNATNNAGFTAYWNVRPIGSTLTGTEIVRTIASGFTLSDNDRSLKIQTFGDVFELEYECSDNSNSSRKAPWAVLRAATVPGPPTIDSSRTVRRDSSITLAWNAPSYTGFLTVTSYDIQFRLNGSSVWENRTSSDTSLEIRPLMPNLSYYIFRVRAVNMLGAGNFSSPETIRTRLAAPKEPPKNFLLTAVTVMPTSATLNVTFTPVPRPCVSPCDMEIVGYNMTETRGAIPSFSVNQGDVINFSNLSPYTIYTFVLYAFNRGPFASPPSNAQSFRTSAGAPTKPLNIRSIESQITTTTIGVQWSAPLNDGGFQPLIYIIQYRVHADSVFTRLPAQSQLNATLTGLLPATLYYIEVKANNTHAVGVAATISLSTNTEPMPKTNPPSPEIPSPSRGATGHVSPLLLLCGALVCVFSHLF